MEPPSWDFHFNCHESLREPPGDTVNFDLAARLRRLTRQFKVNHLLNHVICAEAGPGYVTCEIGSVKVKGKDQALIVAEVADLSGIVSTPPIRALLSGDICYARWLIAGACIARPAREPSR